MDSQADKISMLTELAKIMSRTFWATAWADWVEEDPASRKSGSWAGQDILDLAPETPSSVLAQVKTLVIELALVNNGIQNFIQNYMASLQLILDRDNTDLEHLGHYLACECLGLGVSYADSRPISSGTILPFCCEATCYSDDSDQLAFDMSFRF